MKFKFISFLLIGAMMVSCDELGNLVPDEGDKDNTENTGGENNGENPGDNNGENGSGDNNGEGNGEGNGDNPGDNNGDNNGDNGSGDNNGDNNGDNTPSGDPLTPEESRAKLEEIGAELSGLLNPNKQEELLGVIDQFYIYAEDLLGMESFSLIQKQTSVAAAKAFLAPMKSVANGNIKAASEYTSAQETYIIGLEGALGVYAYDGAEWIYTKSTEKLEIRFPVNGQTTVITVTPSGENYSYQYTYTSYNSVWDENQDSWIEKNIERTEIINIPGKVKATVTKGSKTLADLEINGVYKVGGNPISSDVKLTMGSYEITVDADLNTSALTNKLTFTIDGKTVFNSEAEAKGNFNLDPDFYIDYVENCDGILFYEMGKIDDLKITNNILDLNLVLEVQDSENIEKKINEMYEKVNERESEEELEIGTPYSLSKEYAEEWSAFINSVGKVEASYGDGPVFANVEMKAMYYDEIWYYDSYFRSGDGNGDGRIDEGEGYYTSDESLKSGYQTTPILVFEDDGASFSMAEFFNENDFTNVIEDFGNLGDLYGNCLPNIWADFEVEPMN